MNRRDFFARATAVFAAVIGGPAVVKAAAPQPSAKPKDIELLWWLVRNQRAGKPIALPPDRDANGKLLWDYEVKR